MCNSTLNNPNPVKWHLESDYTIFSIALIPCKQPKFNTKLYHAEDFFFLLYQLHLECVSKILSKFLI